MTMMPPEQPLTELNGDQLRVRVARARVYLIHAHGGTPNADLPSGPRRDHLAYLLKLESEGRLYGYGPVEALPDDDIKEMAIVMAASREEAEAIAAVDPLHAAGLRHNTVQGHTMNEGVACYVGRTMSRRIEASSTPFDPDYSDVKLSLADLEAGARFTQLYLIPLVPTDKPRAPEDVATFDAHFVWLRDNEMAGRLMSCGPVEAPKPLAPGIWGGGLGIVATSREEAQAIADREPSGQAGYRVLSVRGWSMQYGLAAPIAQSLYTLNHLPA